MRGLLILGAGGHGKVCADIAKAMGCWERIAFLDDAKAGECVLGIPVLGAFDQLETYATAYSDAFVAIGQAATRLQWLDKLEGLGYYIATLQHPAAQLGSGVIVAAGTVLMAGTVINASTCLGRGCIVNTCASVDHDCTLEEGVHISVGAHIAGSVRIDARTWVGIGACVSNSLSLCPDCMIGAGAAVVKDITVPGTYVGVPAKALV